MRIAVIDTETSGFSPDEGAALLEAASVQLHQTPQGWQYGPYGGSLIAHPDPIPPTAKAVHHITEPMVDPALAGVPLSGVVTRAAWVAGAVDQGPDVVAYHNAAFDRLFLPELDGWDYICTYRCALHLYPAAPGHGNQALRYWRDVHPPSDMLAGLVPHRALYDAACTAALLKDMLASHTPEELVKLTQAPVLLHMAKFGRYRGELWKDIPASYLRWILREGTFGPDVNHTCEHYLGL